MKKKKNKNKNKTTGRTNYFDSSTKFIKYIMVPPENLINKFSFLIIFFNYNSLNNI